MNRYALWKYIVIAVVLTVSALFTLPNFFGEAPAVQISSGKPTIKVDALTRSKVEDALSAAKLESDAISFDGSTIRARFKDGETQVKAKDAIKAVLVKDAEDPEYIVALNLVSRSPKWLSALHAFPMYLGLDLRGGVHFMLQVDMQTAVTKRLDVFYSDLRRGLRDKNIRYSGINLNGQAIDIKLRDQETLNATKAVLQDQFADLQTTQTQDGSEYKLSATIKPESLRTIQNAALKQNISTLGNRVNALGVAEPIIQQQGADRIVVQLPGIQDITRARNLLGKTATLEARLVDVSSEAQGAISGGLVPFGSELFTKGRGAPVVLKKEVIFVGDSLTDAQPGFDDKQQASVSITLDTAAGKNLKEVSRQNILKPMAIVLFEKKKGDVLTVATIQSELGNRFQITGMGSPENAQDLALLLRAGALAAPMEIIEERTIGPSLGAENIAKGFQSVTYGFMVICAFMCIYYMVFGMFSSLALGVNLLMLVAVLSMLQATLTLPGMAAMALALGMAIDSNVLINERVREELRGGASPQAAIHAGYDRAWGTILDSNITTLIAGLALLAFGSGPVRGFAVVHCVGILTSMFSAVFFSRGLVNLFYGNKKKLKGVSIGTVWRPDGMATPDGATLDMADNAAADALDAPAAPVVPTKPLAKTSAKAKK
jgi:preprotein translocase subunit SecD